MKYAIIYPSMNQPLAGECTMHYVEHRLDPFYLMGDHKLSNAAIFDTVKDAREVERIITKHCGRDILTSIMKVRK